MLPCPYLYKDEEYGVKRTDYQQNESALYFNMSSYGNEYEIEHEVHYLLLLHYIFDHLLSTMNYAGYVKPFR